MYCIKATKTYFAYPSYQFTRDSIAQLIAPLVFQLSLPYTQEESLSLFSATVKVTYRLELLILYPVLVCFRLVGTFRLIEIKVTLTDAMKFHRAD